jgi:formate dehydrogenase major subunit
MATRDTERPAAKGITRRDFLKAGAAATAVAGCGLDFAFDPAKALAYEADTTNYKVTFTTCPYCSASCGQRVVTALTAINGHAVNDVIDIYGDFESPINQGGLCAKGAGALQLVNNPRRIGAWPTHPTNSVFAASGTNAIAYKRVGNGAWSAVPLYVGDGTGALEDIATRLTTIRQALPTTGASAYNQKNVAFFGCSHMNNESNYLYRKIIANFGSSNTEHQARI